MSLLDPETKLDRHTIQTIIQIAQQFGLLHGLLAGLTALIRGAFESEGFAKTLLDAALCSMIGTFVFSLPFIDVYLKDHPNAALIICIIIGVVGAKVIITTVRESFVAAVKRLNPMTWFKKVK